MTLQTTHNTATASLQRELDKLRQEYQSLKIQLRDLEMGNDDLERNERAVSSSLADMEAKYSRVLEEKILLEHELLDKASLEEETQRFKDEIRGACCFDKAFPAFSLIIRWMYRCQRGDIYPERSTRGALQNSPCHVQKLFFYIYTPRSLGIRREPAGDDASQFFRFTAF